MDKLHSLNVLLKKFVSDEDLHDDLKLNIVKIACNHWTGIKRQPPDISNKFQDNKSCMYVFQRLQLLQNVATDAGVQTSVLWNHVVQKKSKLDISLIVRYFGNEFLLLPSFPREEYNTEFDVIEKLKVIKSDNNSVNINSTSSGSSNSTPTNAVIRSNSNESENTDDDTIIESEIQKVINEFFVNLAMQCVSIALFSAVLFIIVVKLVPY